MTIQIKGGSTSRHIEARAFSATTGLPYTTAAYNDAGIALSYRRGGVGAVTSITPATQTVTGAYSSGGFVATTGNAVRIDLPDAALAAGVDTVEVFGSATAWVLICPTVQIVGYDPRTELTATFLAGTPQTGDSFARIGALGAGLTAVGDTAGTTTLLSRLSAARAGYLDNLSAGAVALASALTTAQADLTTLVGRITGAVALATSTTAAAIRSALGMAAADLDTQLGDLPTNSELAAGLASADDATLAAIAARPSVADFWSGITATAARFIADHTLRRSWASAAISANGDALSFRSLLGAVAKLVNRVGISGATLTVYQDDDTTALGTQALTSDADALPVTGANTV